MNLEGVERLLRKLLKYPYVSRPAVSWHIPMLVPGVKGVDGVHCVDLKQIERLFEGLDRCTAGVHAHGSLLERRG